MWSYADRIVKNNVKCKLCKAILTAKGGNTSTIQHHLTGIHHINSDGTGNLNTPNISSFFTASRPKMMKERALVMDQKIADFIARDARPISLVEGDGFLSLLKYTDPDYVVKAPSTTTKLIKKRCDQAVKSLRLKLGTAQFVAFTTGMWTSNQKIAYMYLRIG